MNTEALNAFGLFLAALGVTVVYFFSIKGQPGAENFMSEDVHIVRDMSSETVDIHSERLTLGTGADADVSARREAIGFLGYLAVMTGFFVQYTASLQAMHVKDLAS